jgi:hypothetical protein
MQQQVCSNRGGSWAGVTLVLSLVFGGLGGFACQAGMLDCPDEPGLEKCKEKYLPPGGAQGGAGGPIEQVPTCEDYKTTAEVEEKLIFPRCGFEGGQCHARVFPPRFATWDKIAAAFIDKPTSMCTKDKLKLVDKANWSKSFVLAKINSTEDTFDCVMHDKPSLAGTGDAGYRMPYSTDKEPQPPLTQAEHDCLTWWVHEIAKK